MHKIILGIGATLLWGCSWVTQATPVNSDYVSQTAGTISLVPRDNLLIATVAINWDTRASDVLAVDWIAPKGSYCSSSQFVISRGNNTTNDVSWAYRTVIHSGNNGQQIVCSGNWIAKLVNVNTKQVLASSGYTITAPITNNTANS